MAVAGEVTWHGRAHPSSWSISIVSLRSKESEGGATEVSKTKLLSHVPPCRVSACVRHVPVPFLPGTKSTWGPAEVRWTFSQYSAVSDTPIHEKDLTPTPNLLRIRPIPPPLGHILSVPSRSFGWHGSVGWSCKPTVLEVIVDVIDDPTYKLAAFDATSGLSQEVC